MHRHWAGGGRRSSARPPAQTALLPPAPGPDRIVVAPVAGVPASGLPVSVCTPPPTPPPVVGTTSRRPPPSSPPSTRGARARLHGPQPPRPPPTVLPDGCSSATACCSRRLPAVRDVPWEFTPVVRRVWRRRGAPTLPGPRRDCSAGLVPMANPFGPLAEDSACGRGPVTTEDERDGEW